MRYLTLCFIVAIALGVPGHRGAARAAHAPTTRPIKVDLTTPRGAIRSLSSAVDAQDGAAILKVFYAADASERELAAAFSELILAGKRLGESARDQFGAVGDSLGSGVINPAELAKIDQAELRENGDRATLIPVGQSRPLQFRRSGNDWQLVVRDFANADDNLPRQASLLKRVARVFDEVTAGINAGNFASSQEAEAAIQTKLAHVMIRAATQATTRPATKP